MDPEARIFEWVVRLFDAEAEVSSPSLDINASIAHFLMMGTS